jgi:hypothetical protein
MGSSISSLVNGSPSTPSLQTYQPQYTSQADTGAFTGIQSIANNNPYLQNQGTYQSLEQAGLNNPYAAGAQTAANAAGAQNASLGQQGMAGSTALNQSAMQLLPYISQVENTAMDPQNALYNQTLQQVQAQANVSNAQNGLSGSPYGAGVSNTANQNFNINWQNNQLGRQTTGLGAAAAGLGAAGSGMNTAMQVGTGAAANTALSGAVPNATYQSNLANQNNALNTYGTAMTAGNNDTNAAVSDFLTYMGQGESQSNIQAQQNQINYTDQLAASAANNQLMGQLAGTNMPTTITSPNGTTTTSGGSSIGGLMGLISDISIICTALHKAGYISKRVWMGNQLYGKKWSPELFEIYLWWGTPIARGIDESKIFAIFAAFVFMPICKEMAYEMGYYKKSSFIGRVLLKSAELFTKLIQWGGIGATVRSY